MEQNSLFNSPLSDKIVLWHNWILVWVMRGCVFIAQDEGHFSPEKWWYFTCVSMKTYVVGTHWKHLNEMLPMSTHHICLVWEIKEIHSRYPSYLGLLHSLKEDTIKKCYSSSTSISVRTIFSASLTHSASVLRGLLTWSTPLRCSQASVMWRLKG